MQTNVSDKEYLFWTKLTNVSIIQLCVGIAFFILMGFAIVSFNTHSYTEVFIESDGANKLPIGDQNVRAGFIYTGWIFLALSAYNLYSCIQLKKANPYLVYSGGIFAFALIPYLLYVAIKNKYYPLFWVYVKAPRQEPLQISNTHVLAVLTGKKKMDHLFWNTIVAYLLIVATTGRMINSFISSNYNFMNDFLTYFTTLSNVLCFLFIWVFIFLHKNTMFRENTIMTFVSSYLLVVMLIYWGYLFPTDPSTSPWTWSASALFDNLLEHAIVPLLCIALCISSYFISHVYPKSKLISFCVMGSSVPMTYGLFAYTYPFVINKTIYSALTNLNPDALRTLSGEGGGSPIWILGFVGLVLLFNGSFLLFRWFNLLIAKKYTKKVATNNNV